jgi:hypothetical protein
VTFVTRRDPVLTAWIPSSATRRGSGPERHVLRSTRVDALSV